MMKNEKQKCLKKLNEAFGDFKFFAEDHHYEYKGERVGISVTTFYSQYEQEFDTEGQAERSAKKEGKTKQEILDEWKKKNDISCRKGSACHEYVQSLWNKSIWAQRVEDDDITSLIYSIIPECDLFYKDFQDKLEHVADEYVIGSAEYDIASCVDHLFIEKETGDLVMVDYKTNTDIHKYEDRKGYMKPPLNHLKDTTINHYALQVSIYKYIIEKYTDLTINQWFIVWFSEANDKYKIMEVPYLKDEVEEILEWRKWE